MRTARRTAARPRCASASCSLLVPMQLTLTRLPSPQLPLNEFTGGQQYGNSNVQQRTSRQRRCQAASRQLQLLSRQHSVMVAALKAVTAGPPRVVHARSTSLQARGAGASAIQQLTTATAPSRVGLGGGMSCASCSCTGGSSASSAAAYTSSRHCKAAVRLGVSLMRWRPRGWTECLQQQPPERHRRGRGRHAVAQAEFDCSSRVSFCHCKATCCCHAPWQHWQQPPMQEMQAAACAPSSHSGGSSARCTATPHRSNAGMLVSHQICCHQI